MTVAVLCSGQGRQHRDMFALTEHAPAARAVFDTAASRLGGIDPRVLVRTVPAEALYINATAQILCCVQALAGWALLFGESDMRGESSTRAERGMPPPEDIVIAGYSVGELAAWGCAGLFDAASVMDLAVARAMAMDRAASDTGLAAIRGLNRAAVESLAAQIAGYVAIVNGADSFMVGARKNALDALCSSALDLGAVRATALRVNVASHTPFLSAGVAEFRAVLERAPVGDADAALRHCILRGQDGARVSDLRPGLRDLAAQISQPIDWWACLTACREAGVTTVLELGPGRALAEWAGPAIPGARCRSLDDFRSAEGVRQWLRKDAQAER